MDREHEYVAQWFRTIIEARRLTQAAFGRMIGCRRDEVNRTLKGRRVKSVLTRLPDIAARLNVELPDRLEEFAARQAAPDEYAEVANPTHLDSAQRQALMAGFLRSVFGAVPESLPSLDTVDFFQPGSPLFLSVVSIADAQPGGHDLLMNGLSEVTFPLSVLAERTEHLVRDVDPINAAEAFWRYYELSKRWIAFRQEVHMYPCRHLCPRTTIEEYLNLGFFPRDDALNYSHVHFAYMQQRIAHVESLIALLARESPKFSLGLLRSVEAVDRTDYLVKRQFAVYGEYFPRAGSSTAFMFSDVQLTESFSAHFDAIWNDPRQVETDQERVLGWLYEQLDLLRSKASSQKVPLAGRYHGQYR